MLVGAANVEHVAPHHPLEAGAAIARQIGPRNMAKMERPVCIGQSRGDQNFFCHGLGAVFFRSSLLHIDQNLAQTRSRVAHNLIAADIDGKIAQIKVVFELFSQSFCRQRWKKHKI